MPIYEIEGKRPRIGSGTWVAPSAEVIGDVDIGENGYIGFGAIIRGDFGKIKIGNETRKKWPTLPLIRPIFTKPGKRQEFVVVLV